VEKNINLKLFIVYSFVLILYILNVQSLQSQTYKLRGIDVRNGLSQNSVNSIYEDKFGLIWVGTNDGLNRLEGDKIEIFYSDAENNCALKSDKVLDMKEDNRNRLWLATSGIGISYYNYKKNCFSFLDISYKGNQELVQSIEVDTVDNSLWVATDGGGVFYYNYVTNRKRDYFNKVNNEILSTEFKAIRKIGNKIYAGNAKGQIIEYSISKNSKKVYNVANSRIMNIEKQDNSLFVTTESNGYFLFNPISNQINKNIINLTDDIDSTYLLIKSCQRITDNEFVVASLEGISYIRINNNNLTLTKKISNKNTNLDYNSFLSVLIDSKGTEWYGSNGFGLFYNNDYFNSFKIIKNKEKELSFSSVRSIRKIDDKLWIGGYGGLNKYSEFNKKMEYVPYSDLNTETWESYIGAQSIYCFLQDPNNSDIVWIGSEDNGLYKYSKSRDKYKFVKFSQFNELDNRLNSVFTICLYNKNFIIGTSNGIIAFEPKTETFGWIESINEEIGKDILHVRNMFVEGNLLYCVFEGVGTYTYSFENAKLTQLANNFPGIDRRMFTNANSIIQYGDKLILCTKEKGFYILNPIDSSFTNFYTGNGLNNNCVYQILDDGDNNLWASTNKGISKIDLSTNIITNFDNKIFELNSEYNLNAAFKLNNNSLYFGGTDGIVNFNPASISNFEFNPNLIIKSIEMNYKDSLYFYYFVTDDTINVSFLDDLVEVEVMTDEYLFNKGIKYEYRWNESRWISGTGRKIRLTNLIIGMNRIDIRVFDNNGDINQSITFYINQEESILTTSTLIASSAIFLLIVLYFLYRRFIRNSTKKNKILSNQNEKLAKELVQIKYFKNLIENNISSVIWKTDKNFNFEYFTSNIYSYYGINKDFELMNLSNLYVQEDMIELKEEIFKLKHFRKKIERKLFHKRPFKTINEYSDVIITITVDKNGKYEGLIGVVVDNKEHQKAKQQIIEREELFSTLVSTILEPVLITNWSGEILFANNEAKNVLEITQNDISEKNLFEYLDDSLSNELRKDCYLVKNGESFEKKQYELKVQDKQKTIEGNGTQLTYFGKTVFLLTFRDVTQKIKLIKELTIAKIEAERSSELKTMYLSNLTHELKTPINAISGFTDIIISKNEDNTQKNYLQSIKTSSNLLLQLINDLLFYTKAETGRLELRPVPTNIKTLFSEIENIFNLELKKKDLKLTKVINTNGIEHLLNIDQLKFKQILINLMNNSIKYTESGKITVSIILSSVSKSQVDLLLVIEDTGKGIPKSRLKEIFSAFKQVNISDENVGFGLGLAIVKRILDTMNGTIVVESELEKGSKFTVQIKNINLVINKRIKLEVSNNTRNKLIEKLITRDNKLSIYSYEILDEMQLMINGRFTSKLKNINTNFLLKDISEFAEQLHNVAEEKGIDFIKYYAEELKNATKAIEVEKINYLLENFYKLVELINRLMEKRNGN
jgi:PAS domain S-box-containing protein